MPSSILAVLPSILIAMILLFVVLKRTLELFGIKWGTELKEAEENNNISDYVGFKIVTYVLQILCGVYIASLVMICDTKLAYAHGQIIFFSIVTLILLCAFGFILIWILCTSRTFFSLVAKLILFESKYLKH